MHIGLVTFDILVFPGMRGEVSGRDVGALVGVVLELVVGRGWGAVEIGYGEVGLRGEGEGEGRRVAGFSLGFEMV